MKLNLETFICRGKSGGTLGTAVDLILFNSSWTAVGSEHVWFPSVYADKFSLVVFRGGAAGKLWKASMEQALWTIALAFDNIQLYHVTLMSHPITAHDPSAPVACSAARLARSSAACERPTATGGGLYGAIPIIAPTSLRTESTRCSER